jgi:hypothetical protein
MASFAPRSTSERHAMRVLAALCALALCHAAQAQSRIYSCTDAAGHRYTRDRPIRECAGGDQFEKNLDGSTKRVLPKPLSDDERAAAEEAERTLKEVERLRRVQEREDQALVRRFPNQAAHDKARQIELEPVRAAMRASKRREDELVAERKRLADEEEFYPGRPLPPNLRAAIDANEAARTAQTQAIATQQGELERLNARFDEELARLRRLWGVTTAAGTHAPAR